MLVCPIANGMGGAEQVTLSLCRGLLEHDIETTLVCMRPGRLVETARNLGIPVTAYHHDHRYRDVFAVQKAIRWLNRVRHEQQATLLHATHMAHLYTNSVARRSGIPEIWHVHDTPTPRDPIEWIARHLMPTFTIFTTKMVAAAYKGLQSRPHRIIAPSCISPTGLRDIEHRPGIRSRLGISTGPLLLTVARLQEHKGHHDLIAAISEVICERPDAVFVIVGDATDQVQKAYRDGLVRRIASLDHKGAIHLTGFLEDADLAALYREATALIHPARSEGYGLTLLEAMSMDVPVLATAANGPAEIIQDGLNGLLVPVAKPQQLAQGILRLIQDKALAMKLRSGGRETLSRLNLNTMVEKVSDVYRGLT